MKKLYQKKTDHPHCRPMLLVSPLWKPLNISILFTMLLLASCGGGADSETDEQDLRSLMNNFTINEMNIADKTDYIPDKHFVNSESFYRARTSDSEIKAKTASEEIDFDWQLRVYGENEVLQSHTGPNFIIDHAKTAAGRYEIRISHPEEPANPIEKLVELPGFNNGDPIPQPEPEPKPDPKPKTKTEPPPPPSPSSNANLSAIELRPGSLSPRFNPNTLNYTVEVDRNTNSLQLNTRKAHRAADVKINGRSTNSSRINLSEDRTTVSIVVTAENGNTRNYQLTINRVEQKPVLSSNARLAELNLGSVQLSPAFSGNQNNYTANVDSDVSVVNIQSRAAESDARISIDGSEPAKGNARERKSLRPGENEFSIEVTAPDGTTKQQYSLTIVRDEPPMEMLDRAPSRMTADFSPIPSPVFRSCLENPDLYFSKDEEYSFRFSTNIYRIRNIEFKLYADGPGQLEIELRNSRNGDVLWRGSSRVAAGVENNISLGGIGPHLRQSGTYQLIIRPVHNQPGRKLGILNLGKCSGLEFNDERDEVRVRIDQENRIFSKLNFQL